MTSEPSDPDLAEQLDYYCAPAGEYEEWFYRKGRYDRGDGATKQWRAELGEIGQSLAQCAPFGNCLELACGTGLGTRHLVTHASSLCALDGSQEMLSRCRERLPIDELEFVQADLFSWNPERRFDFIFFAFWLSHIPPDYFESFWQKVKAALRPGGQVFFVDPKHVHSSTTSNHKLPPAEEFSFIRKLNDGREFRIYKVFHQAHDLQAPPSHSRIRLPDQTILPVFHLRRGLSRLIRFCRLLNNQLDRPGRSSAPPEDPQCVIRRESHKAHPVSRQAGRLAAGPLI